MFFKRLKAEMVQLVKDAKQTGAKVLTSIPADSQERCATCKSFEFITWQQGECTLSGCQRGSKHKACIISRKKFATPQTTKSAYFLSMASKMGHQI